MYALTAEDMRLVDQFTIENGIPSVVLMENAARGLVDETVARFPSRDTSILVLCGKGNNGGDAVAAARWLIHFGYVNVKLVFAGELQKASTECKRQIAIIMNAHPDLIIPGVNEAYDNSVLADDYDVIIDGLFGIGINRQVSGVDAKLIAYINSKPCYRIAVDIPSGVNGTDGRIMGAAVQADLTVTFGNLKTGLLIGEGRSLAGEIKVVDIGLMKSAYAEIGDAITVCDSDYYITNAPYELVARNEFGHKGTFGTVGILVGTEGMLGASILAARAAYRAGCGLVKILCPSKLAGYVNVAIPEAVVVPYTLENIVESIELFENRLDAVIVGPGLKEDKLGEGLVQAVLEGSTPAVIDAGALNIISGNTEMLADRICPCVITPHIGEVAKLTGLTVSEVNENKLEIVRAFSREFDVSMVAKSDVSVISLIENGDNELYMNVTGNSGLATAGSGDVLAGVIASLIAQGNTLNNSLLYGVMIHGRSAEKFATDTDQKRKMMAGDIIDNLF